MIHPCDYNYNINESRKMKVKLTYSMWRRIATIIAIEYREKGRKLFRKISKADMGKDYNKKTVDKMYDITLENT